MEITRREILFSIIIICVMLTLGLIISNHIDAALNNSYQEYNTATQIINNAELFEYGLRTNIGNVFVYGDLAAVDPISIRDISGEYSYIYKKEEHYERHSRIVTTTDGKGHTRTRVEYYWSWDYHNSWEWHCNEITFLEHKFNYGTINFPDSEYLTTINSSSKVRFVYYVCYPKYTGTIYANINNYTINKARFYNNMDIDSLIKWLESGHEQIFFWIIWMFIVGLMIYIFYYIDNRWLE